MPIPFNCIPVLEKLLLSKRKKKKLSDSIVDVDLWQRVR